MAVSIVKMKHLCRNKKKRAPKHQPICGLFALAMCMGRKLQTAQQVEDFRNECRRAGLFQNRSGNWVGATTEVEHRAVCNKFGFKHTKLHFDLKTATVGRLLKQPAFFKTTNTWLLCVSKHCLFVQTNKTKKRLFVMDQRGKKMGLNDDVKYMHKLKRQTLRSIAKVTKVGADEAVGPV